MKKMCRGRALIALTLLLACGANGRPQDEAHVANARALAVVEELRIGSVDDPEIGFSRIGGVAVDADCLVYVLESQDRQVRVYDEHGSRVRTIGRHGAGPGEFSSATLIGFRHDTLAVGDPNLGRITLFRRTGEVIETLTMPPVWLQPTPGFMLMAEPVRFRQDGFVTRVTRVLIPPQPPSDSIEVPQVLLDRTGRITDTLRYEPWNLYEQRIKVGNADVRVPSGPSATPLYVDGQADTYVVDRSVAAVESQAAFTVTRLTDAGDTLYRQKIHYQPLTFPTAVVDSIVERAVRPHLRNKEADSGAIGAAIRQALSLPPHQPPITQARLGADDVLWLRMHDDGTDQHRWVLLGPDGYLKGALSVSRAVTIHWSSGDSLWAAVHDEFDVPWLVRYRIRSADGS